MPGFLGVVVLSCSRSSEESVSISVDSRINVAYLSPLHAPKNMTANRIGVSIMREMHIAMISGILVLSKIKSCGKTK